MNSSITKITPNQTKTLKIALMVIKFYGGLARHCAKHLTCMNLTSFLKKPHLIEEKTEHMICPRSPRWSANRSLTSEVTWAGLFLIEKNRALAGVRVSWDRGQIPLTAFSLPSSRMTEAANRVDSESSPF